MAAIALCVLLLVMVYIYKYYEHVRRYPRGPLPLPLIGNLFQFNPNRLQYFLEECHEQYGSIFTVFTPHPFIILMDLEDIKEAFLVQGDKFSGRSGRFPDTAFMTRENGGIIWSEGDEWREQRRASLVILRDSGMGKGVMERRIRGSIEEFLTYFERISDKEAGYNPRFSIQTLVTNVINDVLFGYHYEYGDSHRLMQFIHLMNKQINHHRTDPLSFLAIAFPFIERIPILGYLAVGRWKRDTKKMADHVREDIEESLKRFDADEEGDCFVHAYMQTAAKNPALNKEAMLNVVLDLFLAGVETTTTTLCWAILYLAAFPDEQMRIREEIHRVVGRDRLPTMADRPELPYTCASVQETLRLANIVPVNVLHRSTEDTKVNGVFIPGDSIVVGQIYHVLQFGSAFAEKSNEFRAERFLLADGKTLNREAMDEMVAFGIGKRQCAGETLARMELFLVLATLIQRYEISPAPGRDINLTPLVGLISQPRDQPLVFHSLL